MKCSFVGGYKIGEKCACVSCPQSVTISGIASADRIRNQGLSLMMEPRGDKYRNHKIVERD